MKIYYINKNTSKCILDTSKSIKLYSISFLPYISFFRGSTQLYLIYTSVLIMAIVAASQQVGSFKSKKDKMKDELDEYNFNKKYQEMIDEKYHSNTNNAEVTAIQSYKEV